LNTPPPAPSKRGGSVPLWRGIKGEDFSGGGIGGKKSNN